MTITLSGDYGHYERRRGKKIGKLDISVVTITYNEVENIEILIRKVERVFQEEGLKGEIIVVDDNSPDGTAKVVRDLASDFGNIRLISRFGKFGIASAYERGINSSVGDIIVTLDADLSHPPEKIGSMISAVREGYISIGSRFIPGSGLSTISIRKVATWFINLVTRELVNTGVDDHTNGFIALSRVHLTAIRELGGRFDINPYSQVLYGIPICVLATKLGLPLREIPTPYVWRKKGETKLPFFKGLMTIVSELLFLFRIAYRLRTYIRITNRPQDRPQNE